MKKFKKIIAGLTAVAMIAGLPVMSAAPAEVQAAGLEENVILDFDFDDASTGFTGGNATATGVNGYTLESSYDGAGNALYLNSTSQQYLAVTDLNGGNLLEGLNELTISFDYKSTVTSTNWMFYAAPNANTQEYLKEIYLGIPDIGKTVSVERYNNAAAGARPSGPAAAVGSDWVHIDAVFTESDTTLYIDGEKMASVASTYALSDIFGTTDGVLYIGRANWGSGEYSSFWCDNYKIYNKALTATEIMQGLSADTIAGIIEDVVIDSSKVVLPNYGGTVTWKSTMSEIVIEEDGLTATVSQPAADAAAITGTLTAVVSNNGTTVEQTVAVTINPYVNPDDYYGYLMVHFVEDSAGYAEKIYLDISRGDNPQQWDPLNDRKPILASHLGTTGVRDPFLTYNPDTQTYYIIATDLRVFGGDELQWGVWASQGSTKMNVWESKDLITWSDVRQFDVTLNQEGEKVAELGMMWAPETTWVDDYYGEGQGAFVVYWSSNQYALTDTSHTTSLGSDIMWGVTTDFTQETFEFGGKFLDGGSAGYIDTNILQENGKTYHITKSHAEEIIMEVTTDKQWWLETTSWTRIQSYIGQSQFGAVEGPASFKDHSNEGSYYLFVDDLPTPGYQPMYSTNLDEGWDYLDTSNYFLTSYTKHGGVISLTKAQYDALRAADATSAVASDLGTVEVTVGQSEEELAAVLPETAAVNMAYNMGTSELPVVWDTTAVDLTAAGSYEVTGIVQSISANKDQWVGDNGSTAYNASGRELYSSGAIEVTATVEVKEEETPIVLPYIDVTDESSWYYDAVYYTYAEGLMTGVTSDTFGPFDTLSRAQMAIILYRMEDSPEVAYEAIFSDVADGQWYTDAVLWAQENGIVTGYATTGTFEPNDKISREQMALMMYRYANYKSYDVTTTGDLSSFTDVSSVSAYAETAMKWAVGNGIITGKSNGTMMDPQGDTLRAECATIIYRFMETYK